MLCSFCKFPSFLSLDKSVHYVTSNSGAHQHGQKEESHPSAQFSRLPRVCWAHVGSRAVPVREPQRHTPALSAELHDLHLP